MPKRRGVRKERLDVGALFAFPRSIPKQVSASSVPVGDSRPLHAPHDVEGEWMAGSYLLPGDVTEAVCCMASCSGTADPEPDA